MSLRTASVTLLVMIACNESAADIPEPRPTLTSTGSGTAPTERDGEAMITWDTTAEEEQGPSLTLTGSDGSGLTLRKLDAKVVVQDPLAFTELHLSFHNDENRVREGRFEITLPEGAAVSRFAMQIDGRWQEGEVVEKQAARRAYEDFLHRGQDPALLEKAPGNKFIARVFPIPANADKHLILSWSQALEDSDDALSLPLAGLPAINDLKVDVRMDRGDGPAESVFSHATQKELPKGDLKVKLGSLNRPVGLRSGPYAVARVLPALKVGAARFDKMTVLFDTSASRALSFERDLTELQALLGALPSKTEVRIVSFDQVVSLAYEGRAGQFSNDDLGTLRNRHALGASNLGAALDWLAAHSKGHKRLLLFGDGVPTAGSLESGLLEDAAERLGDAGFERIDAVVSGGVRDEGLLAAITAGELDQDGIVIDLDAGVDEIARRLQLGTQSGIEVSVPGAEWVWPQVLNGLQPGDEALVYAVMPDDDPMWVTLDGAKLQESIRWQDAKRPLLARATVAANLERLADLRVTTDDGARKKELTEHIVALSTEFRVLTDDTALLVLETEQDYVRYGIDRTALADILVVSDSGLALQNRGELVVPVRPKPRPVKENMKSEKGKDKKLAAVSPDDFDGTMNGDMSPPEPPQMTENLEVADNPSTAAPPTARPAPGRRPRADRALAENNRIEVNEEEPAVTEAVLSGRRDDEKRSYTDPWEGKYKKFRGLLDRGNLLAALKMARTWRNDEPGDVMALMALGDALLATEDFEGAARAYGSIIDLFPARADMRRMAGERLSVVGKAGTALAADTFGVAVSQRPDHLNGHRLLAIALLKAGDPKAAFESLEFGLTSPNVRQRPGVTEVLQEDMGLAGAAWIAKEPKMRDEIVKRAQAAKAEPPTGPTTRFVLSWETDANDVDLHIWDNQGGHAFYSHKNLRSGGSLLADVTNGYGPERFVIEGKPTAKEYRFGAHYYSRGPMGYGMGTLQIVRHDGKGGISVEGRPFVVMVDDAMADLGTWTPQD